MTDHVDHEEWLADAALSLLFILRGKRDADLETAEGRAQLYKALDNLRESETLYREYWAADDAQR